MSKTISRKARHRQVFTFVLFHGNFMHSIAKQAFVGAEDARESARSKIDSMCQKLGIGKSYFTFEVLPLRLISETKRPKKSLSRGPY